MTNPADPDRHRPTSAQGRQAAPTQPQRYDHRPPVDPNRPLPPGVGPAARADDESP